jgi:hypothetical protein
MEHSVSTTAPDPDATEIGSVSTGGASGDADSDRARNPFGGLASGNGSALFGAQGEHETKRRRTKRWSNGDGPDGALGEHRVARPRRDGDRLGERIQIASGTGSAPPLRSGQRTSLRRLATQWRTPDGRPTIACRESSVMLGVVPGSRRASAEWDRVWGRARHRGEPAEETEVLG